MIVAFQVAGDFTAKKALRDWVIGIATEARAASGLVDVDEEGTAIGAIEGADGAARGHRFILPDRRAKSKVLRGVADSRYKCVGLSSS